MRWGHTVIGFVWLVFGPWFRWLGDASRRWWTIPTLIALVAVPAMLPLDGPIASLVMDRVEITRQTLAIPVPDAPAVRVSSRWKPGGDFKRELEAIQQFGQGASLVVIATTIFLLDPTRRRRLLDLAAAAASTGLLVLTLKMLIGRPRPRPWFNDPFHFPGPFGEYPVSDKAGVRHAWEFWGNISSDLWSMPSSHTAYAVVMAIFLSRMYPRLKPLAVTLASIVGLARVWLGAHYPTDVLVGALAAFSLAPRAIDRSWGQMIFGRLTHGQAPLPQSVLNTAPTAPSSALLIETGRQSTPPLPTSAL